MEVTLITDYELLPDLREQLPDANLFAEEKVVEVVHIPFTPLDKHLSTAKAILSLTASHSLNEVGMNGPANASNSMEMSQDNPDLQLYEVFFPRDGHVVAYFLRDRHPRLMEATVLETLRFTGVRDNLRSPGLKDEMELGKAPHEIRDPETDSIAQRLMETKDWGWPYYGAVDTTVKNAKAIAYIAGTMGNTEFLNSTFTGLDGEKYTVEDGLRQHINWIRKRLDLNHEGLVEALWLNPKHHANQTWVDSPDGFHHADGSWPRHYPDRNWGVASVELQAEVFDTLFMTAELYEKLLPEADVAQKKYLQNEIEDLQSRATRLRKVIFESFWVNDSEHYGGYFARGTDRDDAGNLHAMTIRTSDMGHLLNSRLLEGDEPDVVTKREAVIRNLFSEDMLCPSGIRTLSKDSARYIKDRYHDGNTWPWVTYYIALGLERHGYFGLSTELQKRVWDLYDATGILPEYGNGSDDPLERMVTRKVVIYDPTVIAEPLHQICQPPQEIQAWTAAALYDMKYQHGLRLLKRPGAKPVSASELQQLALEQELLARVN